MKSLIPFILSTILVLFFQNCAAPFDVRDVDRPANFLTDPQFIPYIQEFEHYYKSSVSHVPIGFKDLGPNIAGICYRTIFDGKTIYAYVEIDSLYWPTLSEHQKINLIFHELGHCAMNRDHVPFEAVRLCPTSFMHYQIMGNDCLKANYEDYIKEMFSGSN